MSEPEPAAPPEPPAFVAPWRNRIESLFASDAVRRGGGAIACVLLALVGWNAWRGQAAPIEMELPRATPTAEAAGGRGEPGGSGADASPVDEVVVHLAGAVARPGVYRMPPTARLADLLDAAGGPSPDAAADSLNLAAPVVDGERIYVPRRGEEVAPAAPGSPTGGAGGAGGGAASGNGGASGGLVNVNTATAEQLETLPGVGPATASAIIDHRTRNGRFRTVDDLLDVPGIGDAKLAKMRDRVRV